VASSSDDRLRAARLLIRVDDGAFASRLLDRDASPGVRSRVLGVARWQRALDHVLQPMIKKPLDRLDPEVRAVLRLGRFEAAHQGVPAPVATDEMVRLIRRLGKASAAGLVNAVLRKAAVTGEVALENVPPDVRWSHPEWLWRRWRAGFGAGAAERAMAAAQAPAPPWVWFADPREASELESRGVVFEPHPWCPDTCTTTAGTAELMAAVGRGAAVVQDPSSQLVARLAVGLAGGRGRAVDLCAAPGGKTALMVGLGEWTGFAAGDLNLGRVGRLKGRLEGFGRCAVAAADATRPAWLPAAWDLVLLDAPCSGSGTLRRHPEIKGRLNLQAVTKAAARQREMVAAALELVATGGVLLYATCSVEPEENEALFDELPRGFDRVGFDGLLPAGLPWITTKAGGVRILPHECGDGFTVHALGRRR
jgi:16S rRNA (cytosine967-C5)-methyltransferase